MKRLSLLTALILSGLAAAADAGDDIYYEGEEAGCASCGGGNGWNPQCCVRPARHMTDWWAGYCEDRVPCGNCGFANGGLLCPLACKIKAWKAGWHHDGGCCQQETACCEEPVYEEAACEPACCENACGGCHLWDWFGKLRARFHGGCCQDSCDACGDTAYGDAHYSEPTEAGLPTEVIVPDASPSDLPPAPPVDPST
jgi:hypothetical protein